jgi:hypothetical protein
MMSQNKSNSQKKARAQRARRLRQRLADQGQAAAAGDRGSDGAKVAKVKIGWFALYGSNCLCDGDSLIIAGSQEAIRNRANKSDQSQFGAAWQFRSTTFGEIKQGFDKGGAYAFDDEAYARFAPLAIEFGLPVPPPLPIEPPPGCDPEDHLVHIYPMQYWDQPWDEFE